MKKMLLMFTLIVGMLFCMSTVASAYSMWDIDVGDTYRAMSAGPGGGGIFDAQAQDDGTGPIVDFDTFCAEHDNASLHLDTWYTINALLDPAHQSAYLLSMYYGGSIILANEAEEAAFQNALCFNDSGKTGISNTYTVMADAAYSAGWRNDGYVFIADLECDIQDQYVPGRPVPIPPAALLLASGLLGLIGIRRLKNQG